MKIEGRRYRDEWIPNYYPSRRIVGDHWLRLSRHGKTITLTADEDRQLHEVFMEEPLFRRLEETGHILTADNSPRVFRELRLWQEPIYGGPSLHIVVLTKRCNLDCTYCHMDPEPVSASRGAFDLQPETTREIVRFALESPNPSIGFEFQGGEPFLNFREMVHFVGEVERRNAGPGKTIGFSVVTNLMVATDDQLAWCGDHGVRVSYTLNGPREIHDHYRVTRAGTGSYLVVMNRVEQVRAKFPGLVTTTPLCVIDQDNAERLPEMIDFYYEAGFDGLSIIRLKNMGNARRGGLQFDIHQFLDHYIAGLDYIVEKNRAERVFRERMIPVVLAKIYGDSDVNFVDWRNPCGDVSGAITYDFDGELLPADEARSLRSEFGLGNVRGLTYRDFVSRREPFRTMNLSLRDRDAACRECAYNPFCGVMPVVEFARSGSPVPVPHESEECLYTLRLLDWTFQKLLTDPLPLVRMIPHADDWLPSLLENAGDSQPMAARG